eukprot:9038117-Pyramimonas_sp.AAC.1
MAAATAPRQRLRRRRRQRRRRRRRGQAPGPEASSGDSHLSAWPSTRPPRRGSRTRGVWRAR